MPGDSRAGHGSPFIARHLNDANVAYARKVREVAAARGQTPAQTALAWVLREPRVASAVIGASTVGQLRENVAALGNLRFDERELAALG